jgi:hypothetical protein
MRRPIHESDTSDTRMSVEDDTPLRVPPTVRAPGADYDGRYNEKERICQ